MNEKIEKYLDGELSPEEESQFKVELSENEALQEQLEAAEAARAALDIFQIEVIRQQLIEHDKKIEADKNNKGKWGLLAITLLILILGGIYLIPSSKVPVDDLVVETIDSCLCKNLNAQERNKGQGSPELENFNDLPKPPKIQACNLIKNPNTSDNDYQSVINLIQEKLEEAKSTNDPRYEYSLTLLLAIAYYKLGEREKALDFFEIASGKSYNCNSQARNILNRLQSAN